MLAVRDLSIWFGARMVLDRVGFEAKAGECIFVLGPNGAGKSTLLRAVAGLLTFDGAITLQGRALREMSANHRARQIAYLPQGHMVHWPLTGRDVVAIGRLPHGSSLARPSPEDSAAIDRALALADAIAFADRPVTELSGGERARVLLARALAVEAPVLIADEPTAALDPAHQLAIVEQLASLAASGRLVIAALHDLTLAARFASRVLVLDAGCLVADGVPSEVLTDELIGHVFAIRSARIEHDGRQFLIPWARDHSRR